MSVDTVNDGRSNGDSHATLTRNEAMTKQNKRALAATAILSVLDVARERLVANESEYTLMDSEALRPILEGCLNSRTGQWLRTAPKKGNRDTGSHLLWTLVKFHGSNGNLWGYPHFADKAERDALDTVAVVLRGCKSSAADTWAKALGQG